MGNINVETTTADGDGANNGDEVYMDFASSTVVVDVSAGTAIVEFSCDEIANIKEGGNAAALWVAWPPGLVTAGTPLAHTFDGPISAMRVLPTGGIATLRSAGRE